MPVSMHFRKTGQGPVLIILHGLFGSSDNWNSIAKKLEGEFTVITPDFRNHGQSPHTPTHTYEDMTNDLEFLFTSLNIKKASILGHSMGGKVAMMFAAYFPEKIDNLIVADISPKSYQTGDSQISQSEENELILKIMANLDLKDFTSRTEIDQSLSHELKETVLRQFLLKNISRNKEGYFEWKINVPVLRDSLGAILHDVNQEWFESRKPIVEYPVTFLRGLKSQYIVDQDISDIKSIYPKAKIIDIPNGHWLHSEQPDQFVEALRKSIRPSN